MRRLRRGLIVFSARRRVGGVNPQVSGEMEPWVFVLRPHRLLRRRKARILQRTEGDANESRHPCRLPPDIRSAASAEMEGDRIPACGVSHKRLSRFSCNPDFLALIEDSDAECTARAALTFETVAHGDANWLACADKFESTAVALGRSGFHALMSSYAIDRSGPFVRARNRPSYLRSDGSTSRIHSLAVLQN